MISDAELISRITGCFNFLQQGDTALNVSFFRQAQLANLHKGETICQEGVQCSHLALIISGGARVYKLGESGREITLYRINQGQSCILTASCIISSKPFPAFAVCEEDVEAVVVPTADVVRWLNESAVWRGYLFGLISDRLSDVITIVEEVAFRRVDRRIAGYLLARAEATNATLIKVIHQQIASDLGTSREVVSRILKDLEHQECILVSRGVIRITNTANLRAMAEAV